jgi:hypothetical protein
MFVEFTETFTVNGLSRSITQVNDQVYIDNAVDGELVTGITIDDSALLVNVDTGVLTLQELYAYETYWLTTEEGIRDEQRFITAVDQANYILENFKIKNVSDPTAPLVISNGYAKDSVTGEAIDVIDTSGGTIFMAPDRVVPFATDGGGGGGDTKEDIYTYFTSSSRQNTFRADVSNLADNADVTDILNAIAGVSAGSAPSEADIYAYFTTSSRQDTFKADVSGLATEANATANKDEIITEVNNIDGGSGLTVSQFLALK